MGRQFLTLRGIEVKLSALVRRPDFVVFEASGTLYL